MIQAGIEVPTPAEEIRKAAPTRKAEDRVVTSKTADAATVRGAVNHAMETLENANKK